MARQRNRAEGFLADWIPTVDARVPRPVDNSDHDVLEAGEMCGVASWRGFC